MRHVIEVTPTLDTNAFADLDYVTLQTLDGVSAAKDSAVIEKVVVVDKAKQSAELFILLFDSLPTVASAENAALDISDAEMEKCIGHITIAATDYVEISASSVATKSVELPVKPAADGKIYAVVMAGEAATYAADSLIFKYSVKS